MAASSLTTSSPSLPRLHVFGPDAGYILDTLTDRDRLYLQFDLHRETVLAGTLRALDSGGLATDPATARWRVLDVGCGEGLHLADMVTRFPHIQAVGLDRDPEAIRTAGNFEAIGDLHFHLASAADPYPAEFAPGVPGDGFDLVQMIFAYAHFADHERALANAWRALKPGGIVFLFDPCEAALEFPHPSLGHLHVAINEGWRRFGNYAAGDRHIEQLERAGFEVLEHVPQENPLGGDTERGMGYFTLTAALLQSLRPALVDAVKVIGLAEFKEHFRRFTTEATPEMVGVWRNMQTIARKPR